MKRFQKDQEIKSIQSRMLCNSSMGLSFDDEDQGGSGGALSAIEGIVGIAGQVATTAIAAGSSTPIYAQGPLGIVGSGNAARTAASQPSQFLSLAVVVLVGVFAYSTLKK